MRRCKEEAEERHQQPGVMQTFAKIRSLSTRIEGWRRTTGRPLPAKMTTAVFDENDRPDGDTSPVLSCEGEGLDRQKEKPRTFQRPLTHVGSELRSINASPERCRELHRERRLQTRLPWHDGPVPPTLCFQKSSGNKRTTKKVHTCQMRAGWSLIDWVWELTRENSLDSDLAVSEIPWSAMKTKEEFTTRTRITPTKDRRDSLLLYKVSARKKAQS